MQSEGKKDASYSLDLPIEGTHSCGYFFNLPPLYFDWNENHAINNGLHKWGLKDLKLSDSRLFLGPSLSLKVSIGKSRVVFP